MEEYVLLERNPTIAEYQALRAAVGWGEAAVEAVETSLRHSLYWVCLLKQGEVIGCGRVVGDGGLCLYIQDIIVLPPYQGLGLGGRIMEKIMEYARKHAYQGGFIGLMAAKGVEDFYTRYGFLARPTSDYGPGMILFWQTEKKER